MINTGITGLEPGLAFRDKFINGEIVKHFVKSKSFNYFTTNLKKNWTIIFNVMFVTIFVNGTIFPFFHSEGNTPVRRACLKSSLAVHK